MNDYQRTDASITFELLQRAEWHPTIKTFTHTHDGYYVLPSDDLAGWSLYWLWRDIYRNGSDTHGYRDMRDDEPVVTDPGAFCTFTREEHS